MGQRQMDNSTPCWPARHHEFTGDLRPWRSQCLRMTVLLVQFLALVLVSGCSGGTSPNDNDSTGLNPDVAPVVSGSWFKPVVLSAWQWQLNGVVNTSYDVDIYDIDLFDSPASLIQQIQSTGKKVFCYFSAGSYEDYRSDKDRFLPTDLGNELDGWPGERWLDIRSANVHSIMKSRLDLARQKGCDGVEPDNMDAYTNDSGFTLTERDQLAFNRFVANEAHLRNLSVGLKNDLDQVMALVDYFDFAVNEQCFEYSECNALSPFIDGGKPVFNAEYLDKYVTDAAERNTLCNASLNRQFSTLILPLDLDDGFRFACL